MGRCLMHVRWDSAHCLLKRDVGDTGGPHLIHLRGLALLLMVEPVPLGEQLVDGRQQLIRRMAFWIDNGQQFINTRTLKLV